MLAGIALGLRVFYSNLINTDTAYSIFLFLGREYYEDSLNQNKYGIFFSSCVGDCHVDMVGLFSYKN